MNETKVTKDGNMLTLERMLDAPKEKVWDAWTTPDIFTQWFGPEGWETTVKHMDVSAGGYLLYGMKCVDKNQGEWFGKESWGKSVYDTVIPKESFTYTDYFTDEEGNPTEGMPAAKVEMRFEEVDGKTNMVSVTTYSTEAELDQVLAMGMEQGIKETHDRLARLLQ